jgi:hypothetical protein
MGMTNETKGYLIVGAINPAAYNLFINGMIAALVYHKVDAVPMDATSVAIDLTYTCLMIFIITALFSRLNLGWANKAGTLETRSRVVRFFNRLFLRPILFGIITGVASAAIFTALTVLIFALLHIQTLPFLVYVVLKCMFSAVLGGAATILEMYAGMCKGE